MNKHDEGDTRYRPFQFALQFRLFNGRLINIAETRSVHGFEVPSLFIAS